MSSDSKNVQTIKNLGRFVYTFLRLISFIFSLSPGWSMSRAVAGGPNKHGGLLQHPRNFDFFSYRPKLSYNSSFSSSRREEQLLHWTCLHKTNISPLKLRKTPKIDQKLGKIRTFSLPKGIQLIIAHFLRLVKRNNFY